jgi:large subunit ribosomal protein L24
MKKKFSNKWKASRQTRKQRKYRANAPLHIKARFMASNLSKELREKQKKRNIEIRKGDMVKIMRGEFSGKNGKINNVDIKKERVSIEGIQRQKKDGTKVNVYFHPSKLQITELVERKRKMKVNKEIKQENKEKKENAPKKKSGK